MILSKSEKIKYLGFDDRWFMTIGILVLALLTSFLFNDNFHTFGFIELTLNLVIGTFFSFCNWGIMRAFMIYMRKKLPYFKDNAKRIGIVLLLIILTVFAVDAFGNFCLGIFFQDYNMNTDRWRMILPILLISIMIISIYEAVYFYVRLQNSIRQEEGNKRAVVQAQLDALQNQSRPHFLFNSLNTLRDIIDQDTKADATKFVDKLSDVYRFILDSGNDNLISLSKELKFAQSYQHIQSERFGDNMSVNWAIDKEYLDRLIAPLSLQLLLENAIKHNVVSNAKPLHISVSIDEDHLVVKNKIQLKTTSLPSTKLGLKNISQRYSLLSNKELIVKSDTDNFEVCIPLLKSSDLKAND